MKLMLVLGLTQSRKTCTDIGRQTIWPYSFTKRRYARIGRAGNGR